MTRARTALLRRIFRGATLLIVFALVTGCQGDAISTVTFEGRVYYGVSGDGFDLDPSALTKLGVPTQSNLNDQDRSIYALDGVDPAQAAVAYDGGRALLLVERELMQALPTKFPAGTDPLASGIPALCPYWRVPPSNCP